jgi:hypothetical protein
LRRAGNVHGLSPRGICQGLAAFVPKVPRAKDGLAFGDSLGM